MTTISAKELAKSEGIGMDALRARWNSLFAEGHELFRERWDRNRPIVSAQEAVLRSVKGVAKKKASTHDGVSGGRRAKVSAPSPDNGAVAGNFMRTEVFLFLAMIVGMVSQMVHTGGFFFNNSPIERPAIKIALSVLFAVGVDSTALIMTIHRGGRVYLWTFAVIHFLMNVTFHTQVHSFEWTFQSYVGVFGYLLLSFVIAFSNFSYTELFSDKSKKQ